MEVPAVEHVKSEAVPQHVNLSQDGATSEQSVTDQVIPDSETQPAASVDTRVEGTAEVEREASPASVGDREVSPASVGDREASPASVGDREASPAAVGDPTAVVATGEEVADKTKVSPVKVKRKEDKSIEHVLKALSSLETTEEKLAALCKKYTDLLEEHRLLQNKFKQSQRKVAVISREKDQLQSEHSKAVLAKSKLESLCRELQRHNKLVKEESLGRAKEEEEKRKEVTSKFQTTINDIQKQMNENHEKNNKLREENIELASKLKNLIEQYEVREQHIEKVFKHKELELQLVEAKLAQASLQMNEDVEKNLKEKQVLLTEVTDAHKKMHLMEAQEQALRSQLSIYTDKYEEFQATLAKSNDVFGSFKTEMDKMTKKIKKLEKDTTMWRTRWENSNKTLLHMAEEKTRSDQVITTLNTKVQKLESLCRALQSERNKGGSAVKDAESLSPSLNGALTGVPDPEKEGVSPTQTPPNTPDNTSSRASPVAAPESGSSGDTAPGHQPPEGSSNETDQSEQPEPSRDPADDQSQSDLTTPDAANGNSQSEAISASGAAGGSQAERVGGAEGSKVKGEEASNEQSILEAEK